MVLKLQHSIDFHFAIYNFHIKEQFLDPETSDKTLGLLKIIKWSLIILPAETQTFKSKILLKLGENKYERPIIAPSKKRPRTNSIANRI